MHKVNYQISLTKNLQEGLDSDPKKVLLFTKVSNLRLDTLLFTG